MCLARLYKSKPDFHIGYKIFIHKEQQLYYNYDRCASEYKSMLETPFTNIEMELNRWYHQNLDKTLKCNLSNEIYPAGFHLLSSLEDAKFLLASLDNIFRNMIIVKCQYFGVLAEGCDYSTGPTYDKNMKCIVAAAIKPLEII